MRNPTKNAEAKLSSGLQSNVEAELSSVSHPGVAGRLRPHPNKASSKESQPARVQDFVRLAAAKLSYESQVMVAGRLRPRQSLY
jgi:hypothetical protein